MGWQPNICCTMMEEALEYKEIIQSTDPYGDVPMMYAVFRSSSASVDYCPWCGRKTVFKRQQEEEE